MGSGGGSHNLGLLREKRENISGAEAAYTTAVRQGYLPASVNLGRLREEQGDTSGARRAYELGATSGDIQAQVNLALLHLKEGELQEAELLLQRSVEVDPKYNWQLGDVFQAKGDPDGAERAYRKAISVGEDRAYVDLGHLLLERSDPSAEAVLRTAVERVGGWVLNDLGDLLVKTGRRPEAERLYRDALQQGNDTVLLKLGNLLAEREETRGEAAKMYRRAIRAGDVEASDNLRLLLSKGASPTD